MSAEAEQNLVGVPQLDLDTSVSYRTAAKYLKRADRAISERDEALGLLRELSEFYCSEKPVGRCSDSGDPTSWCLICRAKDYVERVDSKPCFELREVDLRVDVFSPGAAVRITHLPTGHTVTSTSERTQVQNKAKCLRELTERVERASKENL